MRTLIPQTTNYALLLLRYRKTGYIYSTVTIPKGHHFRPDMVTAANRSLDRSETRVGATCCSVALTCAAPRERDWVLLSIFWSMTKPVYIYARDSCSTGQNASIIRVMIPNVAKKCTKKGVKICQTHIRVKNSHDFVRASVILCESCAKLEKYVAEDPTAAPYRTSLQIVS